jgi:hypothetical protein
MLADILQLLVAGLATGAIYALVAIGFTLLWQTSQTINFAQGEFVMLPAFAMLAFLSFGAPLGSVPLKSAIQQYIYCTSCDRRLVPSSRVGLRPAGRDIRAQPVHLPHREAGTAPHLLVNAADVFPDDAEPRHGDTEQGKENREKSEDPLDFRSDDQPPDEEEETEGDSAQRDREAQHPEHLEGN